MARKKNPLSEAHIQAACATMLELDGWRRIRTDLPHLRGLGVQEKGIADDLFLRYAPMPAEVPIEARVLADVLWIEWKKKTGVGAQHQLDWHELERKRGALTWFAGIDFEASIEGFREFYKQSGLMRRKILS